MTALQRRASSLLRARGGISFCRIMPRLWWGSSPRTRRYFLCMRLICLMVCLFSAHAEVFPTVAQNLLNTATLLRARGGISHAVHYKNSRLPSSPRTRRYFQLRSNPPMGCNLFSAHAEVFPRLLVKIRGSMALLRARGGISVGAGTAYKYLTSSPRTRRYFLRSSPPPPHTELFSAHAEVFPAI